jgi:hypothetical protein
MHREQLPWLWLLLPALAAAQASPPPPRASHPLDPQATTAPLVHRSALSTYRRFDAEPPALTWREANDQVERIGGWRAYAREANAPPAPASVPATAPPPATAPAASAPRAQRPASPPPGHRH